MFKLVSLIAICCLTYLFLYLAWPPMSNRDECFKLGSMSLGGRCQR